MPIAARSLGERQRVDLQAVHHEAPRRRLESRGTKREERALPAPVPDDRHRPSGRNVEIDAGEDRRPGVAVGEAQVAKTARRPGSAARRSEPPLRSPAARCRTLWMRPMKRRRAAPGLITQPRAIIGQIRRADRN